jgi:hypothetical protein
VALGGQDARLFFLGMIRIIATTIKSSMSENPLLSRVFTLACLCFYSEVIS